MSAASIESALREMSDEACRRRPARSVEPGRAVKVARVVAILYVILCLLSLGVVLASSREWFGLTSDPLSGVYAIVLAMPWSLLTGALPIANAWVGTLVVALCMACNLAIILFLGRLFGSRKRKGRSV